MLTFLFSDHITMHAHEFGGSANSSYACVVKVMDFIDQVLTITKRDVMLREEQQLMSYVARALTVTLN